MLQEGSAPATNVDIEAAQRQAEENGSHAGCRGSPGNFRNNQVAHGVVHIAAVTVKKEFGDGISKEEEPTSSASGQPGGAKFPAGGPAILPRANFADMGSSMPAHPRIRVGMHEEWLGPIVRTLPQNFGQQGLQIGNLVSHILHVLIQQKTSLRLSLSLPALCAPVVLCLNELILVALDDLHKPCSAVMVSLQIMETIWT